MPGDGPQAQPSDRNPSAETAGPPEAAGVGCLLDVIQDLRREADGYRTILDNIPVGAAVTESGPDGCRIAYANEALAQLTGYRVADILRADAGLFYGPDSDSRALKVLHMAQSEGRAASAEMLIYRSDGSTFPARVTLAPVVDESGAARGYVRTFADCSDLLALQRLRSQLASASGAYPDANFQFTANLIHELRTPLNAIIGFADVLQSGIFGEQPHAKCREYIGDILESSRHLLSLVNEILDLSKADAGRLELSEAVVDVAGTIQTCTKMIAESARQSRVELSVALAPDLPQLYADELRVRQILINLLANAVKFTPSGGEVLLTADRDPEAGLFVSVLDTGIGMQEADLPVAVAPFGQIETSPHGGDQGTGLGLPLTKKLLEAHGGRLEVLSSAGQGTIMVAHFPSERVVG